MSKYKHISNKGCLWALSLSALCVMTSCKDNKDLDTSVSSEADSTSMSEASDVKIKMQTSNEINDINGDPLFDSAGNSITVLDENDEPVIVTAYTGTEKGSYTETEIMAYSEIFKTYADACNTYELNEDAEPLYQIYKTYLSFKYEMNSLLKVYLYDDPSMSSEVYAAYSDYSSDVCLNMLRIALLDFDAAWTATDDISKVYYERFMEDFKVYENNTAYPLIHKYLSENVEFMNQYGAYFKGV